VAKKSISSPFKGLRAPLSYGKIDAVQEASTRADVEKWMIGFKKATPPKKSAKELQAKRKMLRSLAKQKNHCRQTINAPCKIYIVQRGQMRFYKMRMNKCSNSVKKQGCQLNNYMVNQTFKWHMRPRLGK
jgi:hypothetical protein